ITDLTTPITAGASTPKYDKITLDTKENKQKALDDALAKLKAAEEALDGKKPVEPTPTPAPTPSPLPTPGAGTGAGTDNTGTGNTGSGSEAGYGVNDNAP
ncbi:hypothetical protein CG399_02300, partial [Bifidobacteriaceae bacterium NR015]